MAIAEGHTLLGPGKNKRGSELPVGQQLGYTLAVRFLSIATATSNLQSAEAWSHSEMRLWLLPELSFPDVFYALGFDIGTGLFANPASGGAGHTLQGPGSNGIRDGLTPEGQLGYRAAVDLFLVQKHKAQ